MKRAGDEPDEPRAPFHVCKLFFRVRYFKDVQHERDREPNALLSEEPTRADPAKPQHGKRYVCRSMYKVRSYVPPAKLCVRLQQVGLWGALRGIKSMRSCMSSLLVCTYTESNQTFYTKQLTSGQYL